MRPSAAVLALAGCLAALGGLVGCDLEFNDGRTATLTYTEDARAAYNEAMAAFQAKDWEDARALFSELKRRFAYSRYARLADLRIADIDFELGKYPEAIAAYRAFIQEHRTDRNIEYAKYRMAKALFLDIDDTVFLPPAEERDQATTIEAHREVRTFLRQFPRSRYREDAAYMLEVVTGRLVRHELYVARYYLKEDAFDATLARIDYALKTYPGSGLDPEALVLKGETLLKMKKRDEARAVFESVIRDWGGPFAVTARRFLDEMGAGRAPAKAASAPGRSRPRL
ncbi:outer membrane protein assembly factor BamD [Sorangium sp. So ce1097]|uniref:outer membrane protein assembly factor BamD n=1 Tax=Sorangium sp. So ce1097 TaxID=3133330 RepID=UPI003F6269C8